MSSQCNHMTAPFYFARNWMLLKMVIRFRFMTMQKYCCVIRFNKITMQFNNSTKQHSNSQELFEACVWSFKFNIGQAFLSLCNKKNLSETDRLPGKQEWTCSSGGAISFNKQPFRALMSSHKWSACSGITTPKHISHDVWHANRLMVEEETT